jgi:hypothetical protein
MTVRVLFIGGSGRSGSTLLDRLVGQLPGFVSTGELQVISGAGIGENRLCGCGRPFNECPFWTGVGAEAFGGWHAVDRERLAAAGAISQLDAMSLLARRGSPRRNPEVGMLTRLYEAISAAADGATVVDSSKNPRYGALLAAVPGLDVRAIHLVRDSRGVAYSWGKSVRRPDVPGRDLEMLRLGSLQVSARWLLHNATMELLSRRVPVARVRYESLLSDPRGELQRALHALDLSPRDHDLDFIDGHVARLEADHTVMGNPMRMATGDVQLRLDDEWRTAMPRRARALVTGATWPFLLRYGYPLSAGVR